MKRMILVGFAWLMLIPFFPLKAEAAAGVADEILSDNFIFIVVNDQLISFRDTYPEIHDGITYVPVRFFVESIGAKVWWDNHQKHAYIQKNDKKITLDLSLKTLFTDEGHIITDCVYIQDNKIMAPYKFIANYFDYRVSYIKNGPVARAFNENACLSDEELANRMQKEIQQEKERIRKEIQKKIEEENRIKNQGMANYPKIAYLTFDDGPTIYTEQILEILEKYEARATFFMLSNHIKKYPDIVRKVVNQGNSIGLHGVSHDAKIIFKSAEVLVSEMHECNHSLQEVAGFRTDLVRVPYGSRPYLKKEFKEQLEASGFILWDWNVDSQDSLKGYKLSPEKIVQNVKAQVARKKLPVILMHEKEATVEALPEILDFLKKQNYILEPIGENVTPVNFWGN